MPNLFTFIANHWLLVAVFIILLVAVIWVETQGKVSGMQRANPQRVIDLVNKHDAVVLDIRDRSLYDKGHIANAIHLPPDTLQNKDMTQYKDKPVIVVCSNGANSVKLGAQLQKLGLHKLYLLQGGMAAWQMANLPLVKK